MLYNYINFINESSKPKIDDWIIDDQNDIGQIKKITNDGDFYVIFDDIGHLLYTPKYTVKFIGSKKDIEMYMQTKKYNI